MGFWQTKIIQNLDALARLFIKNHSFWYKYAYACSEYKPTHLMIAFYEVCLQIGYHDGEYFKSWLLKNMVFYISVHMHAANTNQHT